MDSVKQPKSDFAGSPNDPATPDKTGKLVLLIGPSGVGKSVIVKRLHALHPEFHIPRSATTRPRREGESDELYHFVSDAEFDKLVADGKVLEWAVVHHGARYGTMYEEIVPYVKKGDIVIREIDIQGFDSVLAHHEFTDGTLPMQSIFIAPVSTEQLIQHIAKRSKMTDDELARRMQSAEKEMAYAAKCDATVINREGKLDETVKEVVGLINS